MNAKKELLDFIQYIGKSTDDIVKMKFYYGRSYAFAPDDIDGMIVFQSRKELSIGDVVKVKITAVFEYDLIGDAVIE